eukprot:gene3908-5342_t
MALNRAGRGPRSGGGGQPQTPNSLRAPSVTALKKRRATSPDVGGLQPPLTPSTKPRRTIPSLLILAMFCVCSDLCCRDPATPRTWRGDELLGGGPTGSIGTGVFLGTSEKQLDGKRRLLIPQEFRTSDNGADLGVFCFFSVESDCLEAGGDKLMAEYVAMIEALPFGDDWRTALEETVYGGQKQLAYDGGGRITLPESLCQEAGLGEDVVIVGLGPRFQIWDRARWNARKDERRVLARKAM